MVDPPGTHTGSMRSSSKNGTWGKRQTSTVLYLSIGQSVRTQIIRTDLINLFIFILTHPDAKKGDMAVYLYNKGGEFYAISGSLIA
jgi:hypothetical protein